MSVLNRRGRTAQSRWQRRRWRKRDVLPGCGENTREANLSHARSSSRKSPLWTARPNALTASQSGLHCFEVMKLNTIVLKFLYSPWSFSDLLGSSALLVRRFPVPFRRSGHEISDESSPVIGDIPPPRRHACLLGIFPEFLMPLDGRNTAGKASARGGFPGRMPCCGPHPLRSAWLVRTCTPLRASAPSCQRNKEKWHHGNA